MYYMHACTCEVRKHAGIAIATVGYRVTCHCVCVHSYLASQLMWFVTDPGRIGVLGH